jgi:Fe-S-cluster containining protein
MAESEFELQLDPPYASMSDLYRDVERNLVLVLEAYAADGLTPSCQRGCDACCHQLVMTTVAEADAAAEAIRAWPSADRAWLDGRLTEWLDTTADLRDRLQAESDGDIEALVEDLAAEYWQRRVACPFLHEGACRLYESRPLICRHHFSLSDPALCAEAEGEAIERMETMEDAFFFAQDAIPADRSEVGMFPELVALALIGDRP